MTDSRISSSQARHTSAKEHKTEKATKKAATEKIQGKSVVSEADRTKPDKPKSKFTYKTFSPKGIKERMAEKKKIEKIDKTLKLPADFNLSAEEKIAVNDAVKEWEDNYTFDKDSLAPIDLALAADNLQIKIATRLKTQNAVVIKKLFLNY